MISKWWVVLMMVAMLPLAWYIGHNKDADFFNAFVGGFAVFGLIIAIIGTVLFAPAYLNFG